MKQQIFADKEGKDFLKAVYGCTDVMIWKALTFDSNSDLARKIRKTIYEHQGVVGFVGLEPPMMETEHKDNHITTTFGFGVLVSYDMEWGVATLYVDGRREDALATTEIPEYMDFLAKAFAIAWKSYLKAFV